MAMDSRANKAEQSIVPEEARPGGTRALFSLLLLFLVPRFAQPSWHHIPKGCRFRKTLSHCAAARTKSGPHAPVFKGRLAPRYRRGGAY